MKLFAHLANFLIMQVRGHNPGSQIKLQLIDTMTCQNIELSLWIFVDEYNISQESMIMQNSTWIKEPKDSMLNSVFSFFLTSLYGKYFKRNIIVIRFNVI